MLHPTKNQSILQWFNSMTTKGSIQNIAHLSDGLHFCDIVTSINNLKTGKLADAPVNSPDNDLNSSVGNTTEGVSKSANDENNAEANSPEIGKSGKEEIQEMCEIDDKDSADGSSEDKNEGEIEKRYSIIKKFLDDFYNVDSCSLVIYTECTKGKELELAKVAVLVLSAMVQSFLSSQNDQLYTTTLLDLQVQEDIKECLSLVLMETGGQDEPLKKTELHRILSRPSKSKVGTPRRRAPRNPVEIMKGPEASKNLPKKRRDLSTSLSEEILESPLKNLLESPKIQFKAAMFKKDSEIYTLREALDSEETKVIDLKIEKRSLNVELEKKKRELEFLKEEHQKLQNHIDEVNASEKIKEEEILAEKERNNKIIGNLKEEVDLLKKENENLLAELADLKEKKTTDDTDYKKLYENVVKSVKELQIGMNLKEEKLKSLRQDLAAREDDLKAYKQMYEDKKSNCKTISKGNESIGNIIYADERSSRELLTVKENECAELRRLLKEETEKTNALEKLNKVANTERLDSEHSVRLLQIKLSNKESDLESSWKQLAIYENWAKSIGNGSALNVSGDEMALALPSGSGIWPSTSDERERNVKEEPESAKLWETCSGKSMETRSRSTSSIGCPKDSFADSGSCSESEFSQLKNLARSIARVLIKKFEAIGAEHVIHLEEQAQCLGSHKNLCEFLQSLLEALKLAKLAVLPLVTEPPVKRSRGRPSSNALEKDPGVVQLFNQNNSLEADLESMKEAMKKLQKDFKTQLEVKASEVKVAEDKQKELETSLNELNDKFVKSQQDAKDANMKYEYTKKRIERIDHENRRLVKACMALKGDAGPKIEPCKDCQLLREILSESKQEKKDFVRNTAELKALVRDIESRNANLERQLKHEITERMKLEFRIQRESAFLSGTMPERNAVIHHYFQQGLAESRKAKMQAEIEKKSHNDQPQQVVSFNTFILNHENKDPCAENSMSTTFANKSIRSGFLQTDDEEDFLNHSSLAQIHSGVFPEPNSHNKRLTEIQRRNTLYRPHLQSSYPLELHNMTPTEQKYYNKMKQSVQSKRKESAPKEFVVDSDDSQDVQYLPIRKRKAPEQEKIPVQPVKKTMRSASQVRLVQRVKPVTPVRKTGFISKTKSFKTPTSIRRLMRMSHKSKEL